MKIWWLLLMSKSQYPYSGSCKNNGQILGKQTRKKRITTSKKGEILYWLCARSWQVSTLQRDRGFLSTNNCQRGHRYQLWRLPCPPRFAYAYLPWNFKIKKDLIQLLHKKIPVISNLWKKTTVPRAKLWT